MDPLATRIANRFAFKYEPKESKQSKVDRIMRLIRDETGVSRGVATDIADAVVRGRDVSGLAIQKGWPIVDDAIDGPQGTLGLSKLKSAL